jgi:hypothetical protein
MNTVSTRAYMLNDTIIQTKYGLTLVCTGERKYKKSNELHVLLPATFTEKDAAFFSDTRLVRYDDLATKYPIDICLDRISALYGHKFKNVVKLLLDYN